MTAWKAEGRLGGVSDLENRSLAMDGTFQYPRQQLAPGKRGHPSTESEPSAARRVPESEADAEDGGNGDTSQSRHQAPECDALRGCARVQCLGEADVKAHDRHLRQDALCDCAEDEQEHKAHSQPERQVESQIIGWRKAPKEDRLHGRRSSREPSHGT